MKLISNSIASHVELATWLPGRNNTGQSFAVWGLSSFMSWLVSLLWFNSVFLGYQFTNLCTYLRRHGRKRAIFRPKKIKYIYKRRANRNCGLRANKGHKYQTKICLDNEKSLLHFSFSLLNTKKNRNRNANNRLDIKFNSEENRIFLGDHEIFSLQSTFHRRF